MTMKMPPMTGRDVRWMTLTWKKWTCNGSWRTTRPREKMLHMMVSSTRLICPLGLLLLPLLAMPLILQCSSIVAPPRLRTSAKVVPKTASTWPTTHGAFSTTVLAYEKSIYKTVASGAAKMTTRTDANAVGRGMRDKKTDKTCALDMLLLRGVSTWVEQIQHERDEAGKCSERDRCSSDHELLLQSNNEAADQQGNKHIRIIREHGDNEE